MYFLSQQEILSHSGDPPGQWLWKCGTQNGSSSITWELVKDASYLSAPLLKIYVTQHRDSSSHCYWLLSRSAVPVSFQGNFLVFYCVRTQNFLNFSFLNFLSFSFMLLFAKEHPTVFARKGFVGCQAIFVFAYLKYT